MNPAATSEDTIVQEVTIKAGAERIFAALTNPDELLKWWAAEGRFRATHVESDLRPGGRWSMRVISDRTGDASCTWVHGEFRAIDPPRLLIFTWIRDEEHHPETLVRWDLEETDGGTTIRVTHSGLTSERWRTRNSGWPMILELLKTHLENQDSEIKSNSDLMLGHKREEQMDQRVKEFFLEYERANSSSDVSGIGGLYADTFMFGGPNGVQAVKKEDFLKVIPKMKTHFSSMGLSETQLQAVEANPLDSKYLLAKVVWRMSFRNSSRSKHVDTSATYLLVQGNGDALSIVFQIDHQDLASVIKEQQNTQQ